MVVSSLLCLVGSGLAAAFPEDVFSATKGLAAMTLAVVLSAPVGFSLGVDKPIPPFSFGAGESAFGTPGAGGAFAFADPDRGVGYAYTPNRLGYFICDDPRDVALRRALDACLR